jgi:hypothetical protein
MAKAKRGDVARAVGGGRIRVRTLSSQDSQYVGRPGFGGLVGGPAEGKKSVRRLIRRDPASGRTLPAADKITTTHIDLVGPSPTIIRSTTRLTTGPSSKGKKVIRPRTRPPKLR